MNWKDVSITHQSNPNLHVCGAKALREVVIINEQILTSSQKNASKVSL